MLTLYVMLLMVALGLVVELSLVQTELIVKVAWLLHLQRVTFQILKTITIVCGLEIRFVELATKYAPLEKQRVP